MTGEGFALMAALAYGVAGVTIVKGKATARGDNGVFLSVLVTAALTLGLWLGWGTVSIATLLSPGSAAPVAVFVLAGLFSTVLGRTTMYRATEQVGAVAASLLRRLTPVFALPMAMFVLAEVPDARSAAGVVLVMLGVVLYLRGPSSLPGRAARTGLLLGAASAACYAVAYTLRSYGLDTLPDAAMGTFTGAVAGCAWFLLSAARRRDRAEHFARLFVDRGPWHLLTAVSISAGQVLQFFALKSAPVVTVATLGTIEVFFSAALGAVLFGRENLKPVRLVVVVVVAAAGTALLVWRG